MENLWHPVTTDESGFVSAPIAFRGHCLRGAFFSGAIAVVLTTLLAFVPEQHHGVAAVGTFLVLPIACIITASRCIRFVSLVGCSVGLAWGFFLVWLVFVLVQNPSNVGWKSLPAMFTLIPIVFLVISLPIWVLRRLIRKRQHSCLLENTIT